MNALPTSGSGELWIIAGWTMLHFLWLGTLAAIGAGICRLLLRRSTANVRYTAALAWLVVLAALPLAIAAWMVAGLENTSTAHAPTTTALTPPAPGSAGGIVDLARSSRPLDTAPAIELEPLAIPNTNANPWQSQGLAGGYQWQPVAEFSAEYLPWLWLVGTPLTFLLLTTGVIGAERLRRASHPLNDGPIFETCHRLVESLRISRRVTLAVCERIAAPVLVGIVRPIILLPPAALTGWSPDEIEMVLLHELAHVRRWDNLVNLAQRIVESLLFFHPAVWLVSNWVRREREACCDAVVVTRTNRPQAYAELLVALAAQLPRSVLFHPTASSAMAAGPLRGRIRRILGIEDDPLLISGKSLGVVMSGVLLAATLVVLNLPTSTQAEEEGFTTEVTEGTEEKLEVPFVVGATKFENGDEIKIVEVRSSANSFRPGNVYRIKGTYSLRSRERATLGANVTARSSANSITPNDPDQSVDIERGSGVFTLKLPMRRDGWPHVSFYPAEGGQSFGGVYFGTGNSVLKQWWGEKEGTEGEENKIDLAKKRAATQNNLKDLAISLLNYETANKRFPPRAKFDANGKPLLSWRVLVLPYLSQAYLNPDSEEAKLYNEFHLDEPWDSEHNRKLIARMPKVFKNPRINEPGMTNYLAVVGKECMFDDPGQPVQLKDVRDGTSNTIAIVEANADRAVEWTKPQDWDFDRKHPTAGLGGLWPDFWHAAWVDGHILPVSNKKSPQNVGIQFTRAGGETESLSESKGRPIVQNEMGGGGEFGTEIDGGYPVVQSEMGMGGEFGMEMNGRYTTGGEVSRQPATPPQWPQAVIRPALPPTDMLASRRKGFAIAIPPDVSDEDAKKALDTLLARPDVRDASIALIPDGQRLLSVNFKKLTTNINPQFEWTKVDGNKYMFQLWYDYINPAPSTLAPGPQSQFPSLEDQKLADTVYRRLGLELEPLGPDDLARVQALGYDSGMKVAMNDGTVIKANSTWNSILPNDLLVGLYVWPTKSATDVLAILERDDLAELNPLKFYVIRHRRIPGQEKKDEVVTGRITLKVPSKQTDQTQNSDSAVSEGTKPSAVRVEQPASREEIAALRQHVEILEQQFKKVDEQFTSGAKHVGPMRDMTAYELALSRGELLLAEGSRDEALDQFQAASKKAEQALQSVTKEYEANRITQDVLLQAARNVTNVKRKISAISAPAAPTNASTNPSVFPPVAGPPKLLYDGKTFDQWRDAWKSELSTEKRLEAVQALAAFGANGHGKQAAAAILEVVEQLDWTSIDDSSAGQLKQACVDAFSTGRTTGGYRILAAEWLPLVIEKLRVPSGPINSFGNYVFYQMPAGELGAIQPLLDLSEKQAFRRYALAGLKGVDPRLENSFVRDRFRQALAEPNEQPTALADLITKFLYNEHSVDGGGSTLKLRYVPELEPLLFHLNQDVRRYTRMAIAHVQSDDAPELVRRLLAVVDDPKRKSDRAEAIRALAAIGPHAKPAETKLLEIARSEKDPAHFAAAFAVGRIWGEESADWSPEMCLRLIGPGNEDKQDYTEFNPAMADEHQKLFPTNANQFRGGGGIIGSGSGGF